MIEDCAKKGYETTINIMAVSKARTEDIITNAAKGGAAEVLGVDASETGVLQARENAALNGMDGQVGFACRDVFDLLPELERRDERFDLVILDPPAFTKSRASVKKAVRGYREINRRGIARSEEHTSELQSQR